MPMNNTQNPGFTLVELLIGILIFSIVIFTLFSSFDAFVSSGRAVNRDILRNEGIKHAMARITMDLESLFILQPPRYSKPEFNSEPDPYRFSAIKTSEGAKPFSAMAFSSLAHASSRSEVLRGVARIGYFVKEDAQGQFHLYRSDVFQPSGDEKDRCSAPIVCENITGFEARFFDINGHEYVYWDSDSDEFSHTVPIRVALTIAYDANGTSQAFQTAVLIPSSREPVE